MFEPNNPFWEKLDKDSLFRLKKFLFSTILTIAKYVFLLVVDRVFLRFDIKRIVQIFKSTKPVKPEKITQDALLNTKPTISKTESEEIAIHPEAITSFNYSNNQTMDTPNGYTQINDLFGNPAKADGTLNPTWESKNIISVLPGGWKIYYQDTATNLPELKKGIRIHSKLKDNFLSAMDKIRDYAIAQIGGSPSDKQIQDWLHLHRLDRTGGGYAFRPNTSDATKLSMHSYGIAIDWDPIQNPRGKPMKYTLPDWWYDIWAMHGWSDGRHFKTPDPMHVQFATGA